MKNVKKILDIISRICYYNHVRNNNNESGDNKYEVKM